MRSSPLTLREAIDTPLGATLVVVALLLFLYSIAIVGQFLLGFVPVVVLLGVYFCYRVLFALDRIADGVQRLADAREDRDRERGEGSRAGERSRAGKGSRAGERSRAGEARRAGESETAASE